MPEYSAITIWQPYASLIIAGLKIYEWRTWPAPTAVVGKRVAVHAGAHKPTRDEILELLYELDLSHGAGTFGHALAGEQLVTAIRMVQGAGALPRSVILGTALLGQPRRATDIFASSRHHDDIDPGKWGWPLSQFKPFNPPIAASGAQGWWTWRVPESGITTLRQPDQSSVTLDLTGKLKCRAAGAVP